MTNREFLNAIVTAEINAEITDFAKNELAKLDAKNEKRRNTLTKDQKANEDIKSAILGLLATRAYTASEVATALELSSTQKASALLVQLGNEGKVTAVEVPVKGKGKVKSYSLKG